MSTQITMYTLTHTQRDSQTNTCRDFVQASTRYFTHIHRHTEIFTSFIVDENVLRIVGFFCDEHFFSTEFSSGLLIFRSEFVEFVWNERILNEANHKFPKEPSNCYQLPAIYIKEHVQKQGEMIKHISRQHQSDCFFDEKKNMKTNFQLDFITRLLLLLLMMMNFEGVWVSYVVGSIKATCVT